MSTYPGGKSGSGVFQRIISQMPPHKFYLEPFLGSGAVMRRKLPATINVGVDADPGVVDRAWVDVSVLAGTVGYGGCRPGWLFAVGDAISYLEKCRFGPYWLVYCDPPYPMEVRTSRRRLYRYELSTADHVRFLGVIKRLGAMVLVSGYHCELYDQALSSWRLVEYDTVARSGGRRRECLWCNFPEPVELHDYRYYGRDYRDRERLARKRARWLARLSKMPVLERRLLESALLEVRTVGERARIA